jgi:hypothetical protein
VRAQVLLRADLDRPGKADAERPEPPADHRGVPPLRAVEAREPAEQARADPRAVAVREQPMPRPEPDGRRSCRAHRADDAVERLVPARAPERRVAAVADERVEEPLRVPDDLARRVTTHAEEAAAVRVLGIARDREETPVLHLDAHPAQRGVAVHRAHRPERLASHRSSSYRATARSATAAGTAPPSLECGHVRLGRPGGRRSLAPRFDPRLRRALRPRAAHPLPAVRLAAGAGGSLGLRVRRGVEHVRDARPLPGVRPPVDVDRVPALSAPVGARALVRVTG